MAEETGSGLYADWRYPALTVRGATIAAGTLTLNTDYRTFEPVNDTMQSVDKSAGADTDMTYIKTLRDATLRASLLHDGGTLLGVQLATGNQGTLVIGPSGTADNAWKITRPVFIDSSVLTEGYNEISIWNVTWKPTAAGSYGTWSSGA